MLRFVVSKSASTSVVILELRLDRAMRAQRRAITPRAIDRACRECDALARQLERARSHVKGRGR